MDYICTKEKSISWNVEKAIKRFYFGVTLIVVGVVLILERLNLIPESMADMLISWQMLLIGIGVLSLIGGNRTAGTILIVIGGTFNGPGTNNRTS